jgi:GntR family transcriptional regulator
VSARILVDPARGLAPWRQVRDQLVALVATGELPIGTQLPSIRQLARDLGLSAGTVARVYRELEAVGILHTARRNGTVVAALPRPGSDRSYTTKPNTTPSPTLSAAAAEYADRARAAGADVHLAVAAVVAAFTGQVAGEE